MARNTTTKTDEKPPSPYVQVRLTREAYDMIKLVSDNDKVPIIHLASDAVKRVYASRNAHLLLSLELEDNS